MGGDRAPFPLDGHRLTGYQPVLGHDGRVFAARRSLEAIFKPGPDDLGSRLAKIHVDAPALAHKQGAEIVDTVAVVGVLVAHQHAVEPLHVGIEQLLSEIRRGVD